MQILKNSYQIMEKLRVIPDDILQKIEIMVLSQNQSGNPIFKQQIPFKSSKPARKNGKTYAILEQIYHGLVYANNVNQQQRFSDPHLPETLIVYPKSHELELDEFQIKFELWQYSRRELAPDYQIHRSQPLQAQHLKSRLEREQFGLLIQLKDLHYRREINDLKNELQGFRLHTASIVHDLRTPLNCIIGMQDVLKVQLEKRCFEELIRPQIVSSKLMLSLVNDILDFYQLNSGKFQYTFSVFNLRELMVDCFEMMKYSIHAKNLEFELQYESKSQMVNSDECRIKQVILNLLTNAYKFTYSGKIVLSCTQKKKGLYLISIQDTGIGIPAKKIQSIFVPYNKQDNHNRSKYNKSGVGLGLSNCAKIAKGLAPASLSDLYSDHPSNTIMVESQEGHGSTFSFYVEEKGSESSAFISFSRVDEQDNEEEPLSMPNDESMILKQDFIRSRSSSLTESIHVNI